LNRTHERAYQAFELTPEDKKLPKDNKDAKKVTGWMCKNFFDIRTFGAVMSTKVNAGQVRGPVQFGFARSKDRIFTGEHTITRMAVTKEEDLEKERTMGRKFTVPYAVYRAHGFVNPVLADQTGFSEADLELLWESLLSAFQFDQSAARPAGSMAARRLLVFKHENELGKAPSHQLLEAVEVRRKEGVSVPRFFADYEVLIDQSAIPSGVELIDKP